MARVQSCAQLGVALDKTAIWTDRYGAVQRQQALPAIKALRHLRAHDDLAKTVGEKLGRSEVLLGRLPLRAVPSSATMIPAGRGDCRAGALLHLGLGTDSVSDFLTYSGTLPMPSPVAQRQVLDRTRPDGRGRNSCMCTSERSRNAGPGAESDAAPVEPAGPLMLGTLLEGPP